MRRIWIWDVVSGNAALYSATCRQMNWFTLRANAPPGDQFDTIPRTHVIWSMANEFK